MRFTIFLLLALLLNASDGRQVVHERENKTHQAINTLPERLRSAIEGVMTSGYRTRASSKQKCTDACTQQISTSVEQIDEWIDEDGDINRSYADVDYRFRLADSTKLKNSDKERTSLPGGMLPEYLEAAKFMEQDGYHLAIRGSGLSDRGNYLYLSRIVERNSDQSKPFPLKLYEIEEIELHYLHIVDQRQPYPPY